MSNLHFLFLLPSVCGFSLAFQVLSPPKGRDVLFVTPWQKTRLPLRLCAFLSFSPCLCKRRGHSSSPWLTSTDKNEMELLPFFFSFSQSTMSTTGVTHNTVRGGLFVFSPVRKSHSPCKTGGGRENVQEAFLTARILLPSPLPLF